ncbi:phage tail tape measure protein [Methylosinus sp. KRF6]|uniref:phage tail tape measure protein n=1 Tax=Methylosinus sp. KRF6 TaxID=2846853 RepID=UPI001C0C7ADE|nr:phage tail tape measure protein [Methylosinus sp. KRF6]MBU3887202.1 phage tail tape measure protein [Methylosinus sp. KRF6]
MPNLSATIDIRAIDNVSKPARTVSQALKDAEQAAKKVAAGMADTGTTDRFVKSLSRLRLSAKDIEAVAASWKDYAKAAAIAADSSKWTKAQAADVRRWETQTVSALRKVKAEQTAYARQLGAAGGGGLPAVIGGGLKTAAGIAAGYVSAEEAKDIVRKYREADATLRYQGAMADLSPQEMASRAAQAYRLGPTTGLRPTDIMKAQQVLAGRGVKKAFVEPFTEELTNYARAMNTDLSSAAKTLETIIFSTNQHVENAVEAAKTMRRQIDIAVKAAKLGGLEDADIQEAAKFGAAAGHAAGFRNETLWGITAALSRSGYHGSEAGVAARAIASKLVSPTAKGLDALSAMGVNYNAFTTMPAGARTGSLESMLRRRFGKGFSSSQTTAINDILGDEEMTGNYDKLIPALSDVILQSFGKTKNGQVKAQDAAKVAKLARDFAKMMTESVDVEGLLGAILEKHPALQQLNAMFTSEHGAKVGALAENLDRFREIVKAINDVHEGFAKEIGDKRMEGVSGSLNKLEASAETLQLRFGEANQALIKFSADALGIAAQKASQAPDVAMQAGGWLKFLNIFGRLTSEQIKALVSPAAEMKKSERVDTKSVVFAKGKAEETLEAFKALDTTVSPIVSTTSADAAIAKWRELLSVINSVEAAGHSAARGVRGATLPSLGSIRRGSFTASGVQGE